MTSPSVQSEFPPPSEPLFSQLYSKSGGEKFGLTRESFAAILEEIGVKYLPRGSGQAECDGLYGGLRIEELALARACAAGNDCAWETFLLRYRGKLYDIAAGITRESSAARELADSLYTDLYGTNTREGQRVSKLASYTGRGSLEGWLRTVMAQEYVNRFRRQRRLVSLDEKNEDGAQFAAPEPEPAVQVDSRVETAVDEALGALSAEERLTLAAYYLDGRTLAEIARLLSVHESTISRRLEKTATSLRKKIVAGVVRRGLSRRQAEEAMEVDVRDLKVNIRDHLTQKAQGETFLVKQIDVKQIDDKEIDAPAGTEPGSA
jgi:RNA polymerase sigma-70 factor, ECF subfamily